MGKVFDVRYVRRPADSDVHWLAVVTAMQLGVIAVFSVLCRLVTGAWWHAFLWMPLAVGVVSIAWGLRDRVLARRQFYREESP